MPVTKYVRWSLNQIRTIRFRRNLPGAAKVEVQKDQGGLPALDAGIDVTVAQAVRWLVGAQECSLSHDGGVARDFSLIKGWSTSYPETTGYIVPTLLGYAQSTGDQSVKDSAVQMLDWLVAIQFPEGGYQGGTIDATPRVPVTFNTGQILMGLAAGAAMVGEQYHEPMHRAASWLVETQDSDGCWRKHPSPFAEPGEKVYETHVAWGLLEAARADNNNQRYGDAALANVNWALTHQESNGWFRSCCLSDPIQPLTHTIGYALRGVLEAYLFSKDEKLLEACVRTANGLLPAVATDGFLPGRLDSSWKGTVGWACLTGSVQIAYCLLMLFKLTSQSKYRDAASLLNKYVRRTISLDGDLETRGAVKGSFPVSGGYCSYEYPNWASKFFIDSNLLEADILRA